jgi:hypothetical protein
MRILTTVLLIAAAPAMAQAPVRLHGTVLDVAGDHLHVQAEGGLVDVLVPGSVRIGAVRDRTLASIKPGDFVGSAALRGRDGVLHAQEVHIFPEALRGTGEGHRPMGEPEQSMTNATVDGVATVSNGSVLHLRYDGGEQTIEVGPGVRVVELVQGDRSLLVPGAHVTVRGTAGPGDAVTAVSIQAEKSGVEPLP